MKLNFGNRFSLWLVASALVLTSCGSKNTPTAVSPTAALSPSSTTPIASSLTASPPPTKAETATAAEEKSSLFQAGPNYTDAANDMAISFLDVVGFQATVNEGSETLEVVLHMRDIPPTATLGLGRTTDFIEYSWVVFVFLDPTKSSPKDIPGDYYLAVNSSAPEPPEILPAGGPTSTPGAPVNVPINQLLEVRGLLDSAGMPVSTSELEAVAEPDSDTLTLKGHVPGMTSKAVFSFATSYFDGTIDEPDNLALANLPEGTQAPATPTPEISDVTRLKPIGTVRAYPGPAHYAGDVLTFEILTKESFDESFTVNLTLDNLEAKEIKAQGVFDRIVLPLALDTSGLAGKHTVTFTTADRRLNQTYSFEVLPADQRPANEESATWLVDETDCCRLHYISDTAAARDIEFIAEQFQQASQEVLSITGGSLAAKLNVYLIDRMWGNGGFAGDDGIVISYTDRNYGPKIGEKGLEALARHELTHITHLPGQDGQGIEFNAEGTAVYVAGGHYKPEPLAERGAALYDLGYYVPVGQFIQQHELSYLYAAAVLTYIDETYGPEKVWDFLTDDVDPKDGKPTSLETALQNTLGISQKQFDQDFKAWLESKDPGKQLDDLRLTIQLQDLRRQYQETYAPPPYSIAWNTADTAGNPEYLPMLIREADAPANEATELIIANAQQAIVDGDYDLAKQLNESIEKVVTTGSLEDPMAKDYLDIVLVLKEAGYEVESLDIQDDQATARVTVDPPNLTERKLQKIDQHWQFQP